MKKSPIALMLMGLTLLTLPACTDKEEPPREKMVKVIDRSGEELIITFDFVKTERQMERAAVNYEKGMQGEAAWAVTDNRCHIVGYEPKYVDDEATLTLGHEVAHCIWGLYHAKVEKVK